MNPFESPKVTSDKLEPIYEFDDVILLMFVITVSVCGSYTTYEALIDENYIRNIYGYIMGVINLLFITMAYIGMRKRKRNVDNR